MNEYDIQRHLASFLPEKSRQSIRAVNTVFSDNIDHPQKTGTNCPPWKCLLHRMYPSDCEYACNSLANLFWGMIPSWIEHLTAHLSEDGVAAEMQVDLAIVNPINQQRMADVRFDVSSTTRFANIRRDYEAFMDRMRQTGAETFILHMHISNVAPTPILSHYIRQSTAALTQKLHNIFDEETFHVYQIGENDILIMDTIAPPGLLYRVANIQPIYPSIQKHATTRPREEKTQQLGSTIPQLVLDL